DHGRRQRQRRSHGGRGEEPGRPRRPRTGARLLPGTDLRVRRGARRHHRADRRRQRRPAGLDLVTGAGAPGWSRRGGCRGRVLSEGPNWKSWLIAKVLVPAFNWLDRHDPRGPHLWGSNLSVRRDAFERIGGWNRDYSLQVDSEISERLATVGRVRVLGTIKV